MTGDLDVHSARVRVDPHLQQSLPPATMAGVLVVGYRACFADRPSTGTPVTTFRDVKSTAPHRFSTPAMALVSVEPANQVLTVHPDGHTDTAWSENHLSEFGGRAIRWLLLPVDTDPDGGFVIAEGAWTTGGYEAVLTRSTREAAPGAPVTVAIHNSNPWTGHSRW